MAVLFKVARPFLNSRLFASNKEGVDGPRIPSSLAWLHGSGFEERRAVVACDQVHLRREFSGTGGEVEQVDAPDTVGVHDYGFCFP